MQRTDLFGAVDALIEEILGAPAGVAPKPLVLEAWTLPVEGRPHYVIAEFGEVTVTARHADLAAQDDFAWIGDGLDAGHLVELYFFVGGAVIAHVKCTVLSLYLLDLLDFADASDSMGAWVSRFATDQGDLTPQASVSWPLQHGNLPARNCWITAMSVAPIFQSTALLAHILATVKWAAHSLDPTAPDRWALTASAPTPEQTEYEAEVLWAREANASLHWYRAALQELGAVRSGPVDHGFGDGEGPHYCDHHADLFLLPQLGYATASSRSTATV